MIDVILDALTQRDVNFKCDDWECCCKTTELVISSQKEFDSLAYEVDLIANQTRSIEADIEANSEIGRKRNQVRDLEKEIADFITESKAINAEYSTLTDDLLQVQEQFVPLDQEIARLEQQQGELVPIVTDLGVKVSQSIEQKDGCMQALDDVASAALQLRMEESESIETLMNLKTREVDLRNSILFDKAHVPGVDISALSAPVPKSKAKSKPKTIAEKVDNYLYYDSQAVMCEDSDPLDSIGQTNSTMRHSGPVTAMAFAETHPYVATGGEDSIVNVINTGNYRRIAQLTDSRKSIMAIAFSPSEQLMLTASYDSSIHFYKVPDMTRVSNCNANRACVNDAKFVTDSRFISCCRDQTIKLFDINRGAALSTFTSSSTPNSVCCLQGESMIVTGHRDGRLRVWDFRTSGTPIEIFVHKKDIIQVLGFTGSTDIVSLGEDKMIYVSDVRGKVIRGKVSINASGLPSEGMRMAIYNESAIIGGTTGEIYEYNLDKYQYNSKIAGHTAPVFCVAVKKSTAIIATGDKTGVVKFWSK